MKLLKYFRIDKLLENTLKKKDFANGMAVGRIIGFVQGANAVIDEISPIVSKLLRDGLPEARKLMNVIKKSKKIKKLGLMLSNLSKEH